MFQKVVILLILPAVFGTPIAAPSNSTNATQPDGGLDFSNVQNYNNGTQIIKNNVNNYLINVDIDDVFYKISNGSSGNFTIPGNNTNDNSTIWQVTNSTSAGNLTLSFLGFNNNTNYNDVNGTQVIDSHVNNYVINIRIDDIFLDVDTAVPNNDSSAVNITHLDPTITNSTNVLSKIWGFITNIAHGTETQTKDDA